MTFCPLIKETCKGEGCMMYNQAHALEEDNEPLCVIYKFCYEVSGAFWGSFLDVYRIGQLDREKRKD